MIVIGGGKICARGTPSTVIDPKLIRAVFNVEADVFTNAAGDKILGYRKGATR